MTSEEFCDILMKQCPVEASPCAHQNDISIGLSKAFEVSGNEMLICFDSEMSVHDAKHWLAGLIGFLWSKSLILKRVVCDEEIIMGAEMVNNRLHNKALLIFESDAIRLKS